MRHSVILCCNKIIKLKCHILLIMNCFSISHTLICVCITFYTAADLTSTIRLVDGDTPFQGRVELNVNGAWGSVCSRGWNTPNSNVVCKQMGFGPATSTKSVWFGNGEGTVLLSNVKCTGTERTVLECGHVEDTMGACLQEELREDVGVRCSNPSGNIIENQISRLLETFYFIHFEV